MRKVAIILSLFNLGYVGAQGLDSLYAPAPPPNSAFVRVINGSNALLNASIGPKDVKALKFEPGIYMVIPQGNIVLRTGEYTINSTVTAGKFYSAIWNGKVFKVLEDSSAENRAKALLTVYNLRTASNLDIKTLDGKVTVISGVKPGESKDRAVNGITVDLGAFGNNKIIASFKSVALERGKAYSLVVTDDGSSIKVNTTSK